MQKLTVKRALFLARRARRLHKRSLAWKEWRRAKNRQSAEEGILVQGRETTLRTRSFDRRPMPEVFCLDKNTEGTLKLLCELRSTILTKASEAARRKRAGLPQKRSRFGYYDFSSIKYISPTAALILAALYDRMKYIAGHKLQTVDEHKWHPQVRKTLQSVGFHEFLDLRKPGGVQETGNGIHIQKFITGNDAGGAPLGILQEAMASLLTDELAEKLLDAEPYAGMIEAILNSHSWAYPEDHDWDFKLLPNWWLTGAVDKQIGRVTVVVFDQGVSIPYSLPRWTHWNKFQTRANRILSKLNITAGIDDPVNDGWAIRLAMTIARSQTNLPQHGKGLHTMVEVAQRARHGRLRIISRNGEYIWEKGRRPKVASYGNPIGGTLVEWTLDL